jgi:AcrR family transcriptional regulator
MRHRHPIFCERRGYHHGRLKDALIQAARHLVGKHGPTGFTLAEAAKLAGVTPAAPYRHFPDRNALLNELRQHGFALFAQQLKAAWNEGRPDALTALTRMGAAYQAFAQEEPGLYAAMFGQAPPGPGGPVTTDSLQLLEDATGAVLEQFGAPRGQARKLAMQIWALSHGIATLKMGGQLSPAYSGLSAEQILNGAVTALFESAIYGEERRIRSKVD